MTHNPWHARWRRLASPLVLGSCIATLAACGGHDRRDPEPPADPYAALRRELPAQILAAMQKNEVRGLSIALVDDQQVVWSQGFGVADAATGTPARDTTVYEAGSIAKVFTSAGFMRLVEQGRLALDQPLADALPGFSLHSDDAGAAPVRLRHLLSHHAGIPNLYAGQMLAQPISNADRVAALRAEYASAPPGLVAAYSNTGYTVLGHVMELAAGREFTAYMDEALLAPLGMQDSSFRPDARLQPRMAQGHATGNGPHMPPWNLQTEAPAGALRTTVLDLSRFMQMLLAEGRTPQGTHLLTPASVRALWTPQNAAVPLDLGHRIGLAWQLGDLPLAAGGSTPMVSHDGGTARFRSTLALLPQHKLGVVILSNSTSAEALIDDLQRDILSRALHAKTGLQAAPPPEPAVPAPVGQVPSGIGRFQGHYLLPLAGWARVALEGGRLLVHADGAQLELQPHAGGLYKFDPGLGEPLWFRFDELAGRAVLIREQPGLGLRQLQSERVQAAPPSTAWQQRLGHYRLPDGLPPELIASADLSLAEGLLQLRVCLLGEQDDCSLVMGLLPRSDDRAVVAGLGRDQGQSVRHERRPDGDYLIINGVALRRASSADERPALEQAALRADLAIDPMPGMPAKRLHSLDPAAELEVALLGSASLDIASLDRATVRLAGDAGPGVAAAGLSESDFNGDGRPDLLARFAIGALLQAGVLAPDTRRVLLHAAEHSGTPHLGWSPLAVGDTPVATLPAPTGPHAVGTAAYAWIDTSRAEDFSSRTDDRRRVLVRAWYPAARPAQGSTALAPYFLQPEQGPRLALATGWPEQLFDRVQTHSQLGAPLAGGTERYPVILMSHGYGYPAETYTALAEELASQGHVVLGLSHAYSSGPLVYPDGSVLQAQVEPRRVFGEQAVHAAWVADARFVLDQLAALQQQDRQHGLLTGRLDLARVGMFGHSYGGSASAALSRVDTRVRAAANLDGTFQDLLYGEPAAFTQPFLLASAGTLREADPTRSAFLQAHAGIAYDLSLPGAGHQSFADVPLIAAQLGLPLPSDGGQPPTIDPVRALAVTRSYLVAFFEQHLRGRPQALLAGGPTGSADVLFSVRRPGDALAVRR
ncbi:serine hydrolase [Eleftheria terrae]|uniref:serine hydrolase n=1 Tax=Eleftheria terrae TaxID=1597781 RepID=UPI00263AB251|nr:serine hydrolase [Eleftheria terrae]WKB51632.1 serine hydrolase [Eleftheria terrae]